MRLVRHARRETDATSAWELLQSAQVVHLASTTPEGYPVLRVLNARVLDGWVLFHGAHVGEKAWCLDRPAVVSVHDAVASVPSYFIDETLACPATTYYRSVQAHGTLKDICDPSHKARALQAFMEHQQPEGGHLPIDASDPNYAKSLRSVRVFGLEVERITGKASLGQDREPERTRRVVEGLWRRGGPGDLRAIGLILEQSPKATPEWLLAPPALRDRGVNLLISPSERELTQVPRLLEGRYWRQQSTPESMITSHRRASAWVGATDKDGTLIAVARALGDGAARGTIYDVVVNEAWQGAGLGRTLVSLLLSHPALRHCERILLGTRDRMRFYEHFGFRSVHSGDLSGDNTLMVRTRRE
jgi:nitroimidazol reductase NimA-like FMN-containing flavoprotein (pyridoxamine 5'-phosphate oxidase superfamily)/GNAT superfamily N-acetyltransferase